VFISLSEADEPIALDRVSREVKTISSVRLSVRPSVRPFVSTVIFLNRLTFELEFVRVRVWVWTIARLGLKVKAIGQGQGSRSKRSV